MKALVTGGRGFIGSHLTEILLKDGHMVVNLDLPEISVRNLTHLLPNDNLVVVFKDLAERDFRETAEMIIAEKIDWVFHLAGLADVVPSINDPLTYFRNNVLGTINILEASRQVELKKFVYASSSSVYGIPDPEHIPTSEKAPIKPHYPYAETKYQGERWVSHYNQVYHLPTVSLRLFNVYGPRSRTTGTYGAVFGTFLAQKIHDQPFTIVGDGRQSRDFVFVTDVCNAFIIAAESPVSGEVFNVGSDQPQSILRIAELLRGPVVYIPKRPGEPDITHANIGKIIKILDWIPVVSFETGVKIMLENISYWKDAPVWTPESIGKATKTWFDFLGKE